jgi:hypothetical protein
MIGGKLQISVQEGFIVIAHLRGAQTPGRWETSELIPGEDKAILPKSKAESGESIVERKK